MAEINYPKIRVDDMISYMERGDWFDYTSLTKSSFNEYKEYIDEHEDLCFIQIDNILVNETIHSQYYFNKNKPDRLRRELSHKINELKKTLQDLEDGLWSVNFQSADDITKLQMLRKKKIKNLLKD